MLSVFVVATNFSTISVFRGEITIYSFWSIDLIHFCFNSETLSQHRQDLKTKDWHRKRAKSWEFRVKVALIHSVWRSIYVVNSIFNARIIAKTGNNWVLVLDARPLKWHTKHSPNAVKHCSSKTFCFSSLPMQSTNLVSPIHCLAHSG